MLVIRYSYQVNVPWPLDVGGNSSKSLKIAIKQMTVTTVVTIRKYGHFPKALACCCNVVKLQDVGVSVISSLIDNRMYAAPLPRQLQIKKYKHVGVVIEYMDMNNFDNILKGGRGTTFFICFAYATLMFSP